MSAQIQGYLDQLDKLLHEKNKFTELLTVAEQKTGLKRLYLVAGMDFLKLLISFIIL